MVVLSQAPSLKFSSVSVPDLVPIISKFLCSKGVLSRFHMDAHLFRTSYGTTKDWSDMLQARIGLFANFCKCSETYRYIYSCLKKRLLTKAQILSEHNNPFRYFGNKGYHSLLLIDHSSWCFRAIEEKILIQLFMVFFFWIFSFFEKQH